MQKLLTGVYPESSSKSKDDFVEPSGIAKFFVDQANLGSAPITYGTQLSFKNRMTALNPLQKSENYRKWQRLVEWYSSCTLTQEEDRLVAFAGVAKGFRSEFNCDYLAGLWRENLPNELIWRVGRAESDKTRSPSQYRAPSWLWGYGLLLICRSLTTLLHVSCLPL